MIWQISKEFDFCYGHRVWSQQLEPEFSLTGCLACRHLHGHQGKVIVYLQSTELKDGMVTDFHHLNWFKQFLDTTLDHKFIIDINDPLKDENGNLKAEYTIEGMHIKEEGYRAIFPEFIRYAME
jgi:6-pyruvoyltetrahydropterin/6-carboxytetrahydropterin synthase